MCAHAGVAVEVTFGDDPARFVLMSSTHRNTLPAIAMAALLFACSGGGGNPPPGTPVCRAFSATCATGAECCSGVCDAGRCDCSPTSGGACVADGECCPGLRCASGHCAIGCRSEGTPCTFGGDCCTGRCLPEGVCGPPCLAYGRGCTASDQCCSHLGCLGGSAAIPATCTYDCKDSFTGLDACASDSECCSGYHCRAGYCQPGACGAQYAYCLSDADCCTAATPHLRCDSSTHNCECGALGATCADGADCCGGLECRGGQCHPPPATAADDAACVDASDCKGGTCRTTSLPTGLCCTGQGVACTSASRCCYSNTGPSLACLAVTGTCDVPRAIGGACTAAGDCATAQCQSNVCCTTRSDACTSSLDCCSTHCGTIEDGSGPKCCQGQDAPCSGVTGTACCQGYTCEYPGSGVCKALPGTACTADADCHLGRCISGACQGDLRAPCGPGEPCLATLVCSVNGLCLEPPGGACVSSFDCNGSDYYDTTVACLSGTCCLQPGQASAACGAECCSNACDAGGACTCSGPLQRCSDSSRCCSGNSSCIVPDPSGVGYVCCVAIGQGCRTRNDCCGLDSYRGAAISCGSSGAAAGRCCLASGTACSPGEVCCSGAACPTPGKNPVCPYRGVNLAATA